MMSRRTHGIVAMIALSAAAACAQQSKAQAGSLEQRIKNLETRVQLIERRLPSQFSDIDCNTGKFVEIALRSWSSVLFISCARVEPYLEGHRITLNIGNPYSFAFGKVSGELRYGRTSLDTIDQSAEISLIGQLPAGSWTSVSVIVNPSKPEDLRNTYVVLSADSVVGAR